MKTPRPLPRNPLALALGLALALCAAPAFAQDARHDEAKDLDAIVVTANPLRQTAEDLAEPVDVLAGARLDEARGATLGETVSKLPGVQSSNFGPGVGRPIIRGLDGSRVGVLAGGLATQDVSTVSQDHNVTIEPFLADQIEVLKGPATLLYGSGAIGGVVNMVDGRIAERPLDETISGRAEWRIDSVNDGETAMARADASGADGLLVLHADAVYRNQKDYEVPSEAGLGGTQPNSFIDTKTGALGASLVGDAGFFGFSAARYEDTYGNPGEPGDLANGERGVYLDMLQNRYELKGGLNQPFGIFGALRGSMAHTDYEHTEFEGEEVGTRFLNEATEGRVELTTQPLAGWVGAIGAQGYTREFEAIGEEAFVPRTQTRAGGVFVTGQKQWNAFQLDLGARVDKVRSEPDGGADRSFTPVSLSAGALWKFAPDWRLSVNLDRAERAPAEEELFANGPHVATASFEIGDANLDKERATQAEIGLHYHGKRFEAKASVYQTNFDGFVYLADSGEFAEGEEGEDPLPIRLWTQDDAKFRGFEVEGIAHLLDNEAGKLDLRVFGDRVRATLDSGGNLPRIAPARAGADLRWDANAWRASIGAVRYDKQDEVADGETPTDGYTLVDAHVAYHWDTDALGFEVFLDGNNLTDEVARVHTSFLKDRVVLPGRNVTAGVRIFF